MKQKTLKITDSTLVQYQQNRPRRNDTSTDPTTSMTLTTTVTGFGFQGRPKR